MQVSEIAKARTEKKEPVLGLRGSRVATIRATQLKQGVEPCFLTEKRLLCRQETCEWRQECCRLVAAWKR